MVVPPLEELSGFRVLVVDPPWPVKKILRRCRPNQTESLDYSTMSLDEICNLPINGVAADNAILFLWTIQKFLESGFSILRAWGFKYQRCLTWDKGNGMCLFGFHHRTEFVLVGYRGTLDMWPKRKTIPTIFKAKSTRHSAKPDEFYRMVEPLGEPRIDIFARTRRVGWDVFSR